MNEKEKVYATLLNEVQETHPVGADQLHPASEFSRTCRIVRCARVGDVVEARTLKPAWFEDGGPLTIAGPLWTGLVLELEDLKYIKIKGDHKFGGSEVEVLRWPRLKYLFIHNRGSIRRRRRKQTEFCTPPPL